MARTVPGVTRGRTILIAVAISLGLVVGSAVGSVHGDCEHTCPAQGPCPTPADCLTQAFNWTAAIALGVLVVAVVSGIGLVLIKRATR